MSDKLAQKKVLMLAYYYPPCKTVGGLRSSKFCKYLHLYGWKAEVITAFGKSSVNEDENGCFVHKTLRIDMEEVANNLTQRIKKCFEDIYSFLKKIIFFKKNSNPQGSPGKNIKQEFFKNRKYHPADLMRKWLIPDSQCFWLLTAFIKSLWYTKNCNIIYSSASPFTAHVLGLLLKKITRKPWVADYRDEWSLNIVFEPPTRIHKYLIYYIDKLCVINADRVINVTEARTEVFRKHFIEEPKDKFLTLHNGYDEMDEYLKIKPQNGKIFMTSIGSLYGGRDARPFLRVISKLIADGKIEKSSLQINLVGGTYPALLKTVTDLNLDAVIRVMPRIEQSEALRLLAESHIALLFGSEMEKVALTTKFYEYIGMGKTIIAMVPPGILSDYVVKVKGYSVAPYDLDQIANAILEALKTCNKSILEDAEVKSFVERFHRKKLTGELVSIFESVI